MSIVVASILIVLFVAGGLFAIATIVLWDDKAHRERLFARPEPAALATAPAGRQVLS